jgi:Uma2 family endonuclease
MAYLMGDLEIMTPARPHEGLKFKIGHLVAVWCLETGIEFSGYGSWTLEGKSADHGVEPDECYVFGNVPEPERPDLAIEVVWTSGGIDKLEIYRRLGVPEVWFWRRGRLTAHVLRGDQYAQVLESAVLPGIELTELAGFLDRPTASQAIREYRAALLARRG